MTIQQSLFPVCDAFRQVQGYITCKWMRVRYIQPTTDMILIHIEPSDDIPDDVDMEYYLMEQADVYADDFAEWFPHLNVYLTERDKDWYIISIKE